MAPHNPAPCISHGFPATRRRFAGLYRCLKIPEPLLHLIGAEFRVCSPLLCGVINSLPSVKRFEDEMRCTSAQDDCVYVSCLQAPGLEVQEPKAGLGNPTLCPLPCRRQRGQPFPKVWKAFACRLFPKPPNRAASQGFSPTQSAYRAHSTWQDQALLISFPLPSSA